MPTGARSSRTRKATRRSRRAATSSAPRGDAYDVAVRYLGPRPRSVAEITRHLRSKRFDDAAIDKAIDTLRAQRYLDDETFARYWVEQRDEHRPRGERAIVSELMQKGVAREVIEVVLGEREPDADVKRAREAIRRPITRWQAMDEAERKRKIHQYLAQRGFSYDVIEEVVEHPVEESTE
ncbi:MAG: regulatory protein RecX [Chloroflexota bacterium]|nr:regulatory protein RecX [Chloroflexota bacterium]